MIAHHAAVALGFEHPRNYDVEQSMMLCGTDLQTAGSGNAARLYGHG
jgi:hypothetical protein